MWPAGRCPNLKSCRDAVVPHSQLDASSLMLKREVEIGGEYAWQERYAFPENEYRKVALLKFLSNPGGRHVLVRDKDGEFETHLERLVKLWSEAGQRRRRPSSARATKSTSKTSALSRNATRSASRSNRDGEVSGVSSPAEQAFRAFLSGFPAGWRTWQTLFSS